jgi:hypothetical protein
MNGVRTLSRIRSLGDRELRLTLAAMTLVALIVALWVTRTINPLRGDSVEYLYFDRSRTVGYPAFLELVRLSTGHVALAVQVQMILLAGALLFLGWSFHEIVRRPAWSIFFQALLLVQAGMWFSSAFIMTEALSAALVAAWCAQLLRMVQAATWRRAMSLVALSAVATTVRPSLVALFLGTAIILIVALSARERIRALTVAAAALAGAWLATPVAQYLVHGSAETTSPFARGVLQHTLYCDPNGTPRDPDSRLVEEEAGSVRNYIGSAPFDLREQLRRSYSTPLRFGSIIPILGRRHGLQFRSQVDSYLSAIASQRVRANPTCYLSGVATEYVRMTVFATDPTLEDGRRINAFMALHPPVEVPQYPVLPGDEQLARRAAREVQNRAAGLNPVRQRLDVAARVPFFALLPMRLLFAGAALIGLGALLGLPFRRQLAPELRQITGTAAAMGMAFHVALFITAIVEIGFFRYLVPFWPIVCTLITLPMFALIEIRSRQPSAALLPEVTGLAPVLPMGQ